MAGKVTTKQRITADPSIGVADLLECLEGWLDEEKNYNLDKMLKPPKEATWKTVADPDWLSKLAPLWTRYIKLAPNGVIPSKKHRTSIEKLCERKEIPKGKLSTEAFAEDMGERIRIGLSQLRGIKVCPLARQRCLRKTGPEEQKVIEGLIALLTDLEEVDNPSTKPSTAIVPFERKDSPESLEAHEPSSSKGVNPIDVMIDPLSVFSRVLAKPDFDDHDDVPPSSSRAFGKTLKTTVSSPSKFVGFLAGAELDPQELRLLKACQAQEPLNKGFNSQLQRANKAIKKLKAEETDDEHEEEEDQGKTLGQSPGAKTTKVKSKAKKGGKGSSKGKKKNCAAKKDGKAKVETMEPQESQDELPKTGTKSEEKKSTKTEKQVKPDEENPGESSKLEDVPEGFDATVSRAQNRKRYTSRAWHAGADEAKAMGKTGKQRLQHARKHSRKASQEFDRLWPRPTENANVKKKKVQTLKRARQGNRSQKMSQKMMMMRRMWHHLQRRRRKAVLSREAFSKRRRRRNQMHLRMLHQIPRVQILGMSISFR